MITCCVKGCSNQSRLNKKVSYHKIPIELREKLGETTAIGESLLKKVENLFLHTSIKISENLDIKRLRWNKIDSSKEKNILRKDALRVSEEVAWRCSVGNEKN